MIEEIIKQGWMAKLYLYSSLQNISTFIIKSQSDLIECGFINNKVVNAYIFVPINVKINSFFTKWNKHAHTHNLIRN